MKLTDPIDTRLVAFIRAEILLVDAEIDADTDLLLGGAVDSLGVIRITDWIEDETDIFVNPGDVTIENFQTVARMVAYISSRTASV